MKRENVEEELYEKLEKRGVNVDEFRKMRLPPKELGEFVRCIDRLLLEGRSDGNSG